MERLTEHHVDGKGAYMVCSGACIDDDFDCNNCKKLEDIVDRLAAYEDTGLEPEEIDSAFIHEIIKENARLKSELERLRADPNAPLTLDELREMDGEPVWCHTIGKWMLVELKFIYGPRAVGCSGWWLLLERGIFYRRKPVTRRAVNPPNEKPPL